jgi:heme oxygenase (mycobilin-producing)
MTLRSLFLAGLSAIILASPAAAEVVLINVFEVPPGREDDTVAAWEQARDFLSREPGYVSTTLHRALDPEARFAMINVAIWEDAASFERATARLRDAGAFKAPQGLRATPALYEVIRGGEEAPE